MSSGVRRAGQGWRAVCRVIVTLFNWKDYGGVSMYLHWAGVAESPLSYAHHDSFYVYLQVGLWAKAYAEKLVIWPRVQDDLNLYSIPLQACTRAQ